MNKTSPRIALTAVAVLGLVAAACGDDDDDGATDTTAAAADATSGDTATATSAAEGSAPAGGEATVATAESDLGTILVDGEGLTLYLFMPDAQGAPTCEADCAAAWPALVGPATAGEGADDSLLATATRADDGSEQVTYNGWPLYYFAQDSAPGDVNGQEVGDVWYVVSPEGEAIHSEGESEEPTTS